MYLLDLIVCFVKITSQISKQLQHVSKTRLHRKKRRELLSLTEVPKSVIIFLSSCLSEEIQTVKHHSDLLLCSSILSLWLNKVWNSPCTWNYHQPLIMSPRKCNHTAEQSQYPLVSHMLVPSSWRPAHHLHHWGQQTHPPLPPHPAEGFQRSTYF